MKQLILTLSFALAASARADLLVTPTFTSGAYDLVLVTNAPTPSFRSSYNEAVHATSFSSSATFGIPFRATASFNNDFFRVFGAPGEINTVRLRGTSGSAAVVSSPNPFAIQASGSATNLAEFDVTTDVHYDLTGFLSIASVSTIGQGSALAFTGLRLTQFGQVGGVFASLNALANNTLPLNFSGTLTPGHYILETYATSAATAPAIAGSNWSATASFDASLAFTPVPTPGALSFLGLSLLFSRRRR